MASASWSFGITIGDSSQQAAVLSGFVGNMGWTPTAGTTQSSAAVSYIATFMKENYRTWLASSAVATAITGVNSTVSAVSLY